MSPEKLDLGKYLEKRKTVFIESDAKPNSESFQDIVNTIWDLGNYFTQAGIVTLRVPSSRLAELGLLSERANEVVQKGQNELNVIVMEKKDDLLVITETYRKGIFNYYASDESVVLGASPSIQSSVFEQEMMILKENKENKTIGFKVLKRKVDPMKLDKMGSLSALDVAPTGANLDSIVQKLLEKPEQSPFEMVEPTATMVNTTLALIIDGIDRNLTPNIV